MTGIRIIFGDRTVFVYVFEAGEDAAFYMFDEEVSCRIFPENY